ncbi:MAG TPA: OsmC family protein [Gammaproteobacteria bacterium]
MIEASVENWDQHHAAVVATNNIAREVAVPPSGSGTGSSVNGSELLCLAVATSYCNDIYREGRERGIEVLRVNVDVQADFQGTGEPLQAISYRARVAAKGDEQAIRELMLHTDQVAEIQTTLRKGMDVKFEPAEIIVEG